MCRPADTPAFDTLTGTVPIAVIAFDFDPLLRLAEGLVVRWQTVALAVVIAAALISAGLSARRVGLRPDDLLIIAVGIVPGAVIGGRIGFALLHLDYYGSRLTELVDPSIGGLELGLAVVGGLLTGGVVAGLLGAPLGRWMHLATLPVLFALGAGKLTMALGGSGQGQPNDAAWATAYLGPGPWGSLAPALPSVPSQILEGAVTLGIAVVFGLWLTLGGFRSRDGRVLWIALAAWAVGRALVALTWRDPAVLGPLPMGSVIAFAIAAGCVLVALAMTLRPRRTASPVDDDPVGTGAPGAHPDEPATIIVGTAAEATSPGYPRPAPTEPRWPESEERPGS
jgi:prolipoprotein diacylglyceryltransferase